MARKAKNKSKAKRVTKRVVKKPRRTPAKGTKARMAARKPHEAKAANASRLKEKSAAHAAGTSIEDIPHGDGYFIPYEKLVLP
jgi:hypothetical protein